ncbi:antirestriction protein ArdA [Prevotella sp.]|uniref:antirestriction protein ArdA n=1 Tax=Prevotella sp. TaxID=59823 RepID=UPI0027E26BEF|nr:antirestriction protein ArdA [Prevotella sp.]
MLHADEEDLEFIFQDYQYFPIFWYSESGIGEEVFNKIKAFINLADNRQKAFKAFVSVTGDDSIYDFEDRYMGEFESEEDFASYIVNECYGLERIMGNLSMYFDYKAYAMDLFISDYIFEDGNVFSR